MGAIQHPIHVSTLLVLVAASRGPMHASTHSHLIASVREAAAASLHRGHVTGCGLTPGCSGLLGRCSKEGRRNHA